MDAASIVQLGPMATGVPIQVWQNVSTADLKSQISSVSEMATDLAKSGRGRAVLRQIAKKLKNDVKAMVESKEIMKQLTVRQLRGSITNVTADLGLDSGKDPQLTPSQVFFLGFEYK